MLTPRQIDARRNGIGGSDAPLVLLGEQFGKTRLDLWREKCGLATAPDISGEPDILRGNAMEPFARDIFARSEPMRGYTVTQSDITHTHPTHAHMIGHLDGLVSDERGHVVGVVEIKCPRSWTFRTIADFGVGEKYQIQIAHYLAVTGLPRAWLAVFSADSWEVQVFEIPRDEDLIARIIEAESRFWASVVERDEDAIQLWDGPPVVLPAIGAVALQLEERDPMRDELQHAMNANLNKSLATEAADSAKARLLDLWPLMPSGEKAKTLIWDAGRATMSATKKGYSIRLTEKTEVPE